MTQSGAHPSVQRERPGVATDRRRFRKWLHVQLDPSAWRRNGLSPVNLIVAAFIVVSCLVAVLETEPLVAGGHELMFDRLELTFGVVFSVEFLARIWSIVEQPGVRSPWRRRLRFLFSFPSVFDLLAIAATLLPVWGASGALFRLVRLLRIMRLARLGRLTTALRTLHTAVSSRRYELAAAGGLALLVILFGATALYLAEGHVQPDRFGSIPRALWWAVITMTTIGYGDAYPVTPLGKFFAALVAGAGIAIIAMPTGILAAAFTDACQQDRLKKEAARAQSRQQDDSH
jgi:voltage-gated potassium channel